MSAIRNKGIDIVHPAVTPNLLDLCDGGDFNAETNVFSLFMKLSTVGVKLKSLVSTQSRAYRMVSLDVLLVCILLCIA